MQNKKYLDSYAESLKSKANNCTDCYYPNRLMNKIIFCSSFKFNVVP